MTIERTWPLLTARIKRGLQPGLRRHEQQYFREQLALLGLGLENRLKDKVSLLSGGQRQALTVLMATIVHAKIAVVR